MTVPTAPAAWRPVRTTAVAFFEAMGFVLQGAPVPVPGLRTPDGGRHHVQLMAQEL